MISTLGRDAAARSWLALVALSSGGLATSGYLTYSHYADRATVCAGVGSCELVQSSEYSVIAGVPVALMGVAFFVALASLSVARLLGGANGWAGPLAFSMALGGVGFVSYLTYLELFVIDAICPWCVATALLAAACLAAVVWGIASAEREDGR